MTGITDSIYATLLADGHSSEYAANSVERFHHELSSRFYGEASLSRPHPYPEHWLPQRGYAGAAVYGSYPFRD